MNERQRKALELRDSGHTFKEIGEIMGVTTERARQIMLRAQRHLKYAEANKVDPENYPSLSVRSANALKNFAGACTRSEIINLVHSGVDLTEIPNIGLKSRQEILDYVNKECPTTSPNS